VGPLSGKFMEILVSEVRLGNFGDTRSAGKGVDELRLHFGTGYRIYYG
jgi:putative addiction module killer protein